MYVPDVGHCKEFAEGEVVVGELEVAAAAAAAAAAVVVVAAAAAAAAAGAGAADTAAGLNWSATKIKHTSDSRLLTAGWGKGSGYSTPTLSMQEMQTSTIQNDGGST